MSTSNPPAVTAPSAEEMLAAVRELAPAFAERAAWAEAERRIPQESIDAMAAAGLFKSIVPTRYGGSAITLQESMRISAEIAKSCGSTAWVYTLISDVTAFPAQLLGDEGCAEIYRDPSATACGVLAHNGTAVAVEGGFNITGSWGFASGSLHADWFCGGCIVLDAEGGGEPGYAFFRLSEAEIKDTWFIAGMKGTGSNTVVAQDIFVPQSRIGMLADRGALEAQVRPDAEPCERWPMAAYFSVGLVGTSLGLVEAALDLVSKNMAKRGVSYFDFEKQQDSGVLLHHWAEARMHYESAQAHIDQCARMLDEDTRHTALSYETRARIRAKGAFACQELRTAMNLLVNIGGGGAFAEANPLQRMWRDLEVGSRHALDNTAGCLEAYARAHQGVKNITAMI